MTKDDVKIAAAFKFRLSYQPAKCDTLDGIGGYQLGLQLAAHDIANILAADNPRFDRARFYAACGMEGNLGGKS